MQITATNCHHGWWIITILELGRDYLLGCSRRARANWLARPLTTFAKLFTRGGYHPLESFDRWKHEGSGSSRASRAFSLWFFLTKDWGCTQWMPDSLSEENELPENNVVISGLIRLITYRTSLIFTHLLYLFFTFFPFPILPTSPWKGAEPKTGCQKPLTLISIWIRWLSLEKDVNSHSLLIKRRDFNSVS